MLLWGLLVNLSAAISYSFSTRVEAVVLRYVMFNVQHEKSKEVFWLEINFVVFFMNIFSCTLILYLNSITFNRKQIYDYVSVCLLIDSLIYF